MKKWFKPQISELGIVDTLDDLDTLDPKTHDGYCHKLEGSCNGLINDHNASGKDNHTWTGNPCLEHGVGNNGQVACCCGPGASQDSNSNECIRNTQGGKSKSVDKIPYIKTNMIEKGKGEKYKKLRFFQ